MTDKDEITELLKALGRYAFEQKSADHKTCWCGQPAGDADGWCGRCEPQSDRRMSECADAERQLIVLKKLVSELTDKLNDLLEEKEELRNKYIAACDASGFRNVNKELFDEYLDGVADDSALRDRESLAAHYACAMANWSIVLDERNELKQELEELKQNAQDEAWERDLLD